MQDMKRTLEKFAHVFNGHERGGIRPLVFLQTTEPSAQLDGGDLMTSMSISVNRVEK